MELRWMAVRSGWIIPLPSAPTLQLLGCTWVVLQERRKKRAAGAAVVVDLGEEEEEEEIGTREGGAMREGGTDMREEGMTGAMEEIGMAVTGGIDMAVIDMVAVNEGGIGMVEEVIGMPRTGMEEEEGPGDRDLPAPTTGSKDQGGIIDQEAGAMSDQDTENNEFEIKEPETKPIFVFTIISEPRFQNKIS